MNEDFYYGKFIRRAQVKLHDWLFVNEKIQIGFNFYQSHPISNQLWTCYLLDSIQTRRYEHCVASFGKSSFPLIHRWVTTRTMARAHRLHLIPNGCYDHFPKVCWAVGTSRNISWQHRQTKDGKHSPNRFMIRRLPLWLLDKLCGLFKELRERKTQGVSGFWTLS